MTDWPSRPRIVITVADPLAQSEPSIALQKNALYAEAMLRHGADPVVLDASAYVAERASAFDSMDGLLLSGGADLDPALYGEAQAGAKDIEPDRDALEAEAWSAAIARSVPILGLCRGLQAINVFSGGTLLQDVDGHLGAGWGHGPAATHPLQVAPGSVLGGLVGETLEVNSYHHQGIRASDLAPGLVATAWADSSAGPLIEGVEGDSDDGRFLIGVQCHPERTDSTPAAFERLFAAFVEAARSRRG
jgi:putative glutamine amidotransferase